MCSSRQIGRAIQQNFSSSANISFPFLFALTILSLSLFFSLVRILLLTNLTKRGFTSIQTTPHNHTHRHKHAHTHTNTHSRVLETPNRTSSFRRVTSANPYPSGWVTTESHVSNKGNEFTIDFLDPIHLPVEVFPLPNREYHRGCTQIWTIPMARSTPPYISE